MKYPRIQAAIFGFAIALSLMFAVAPIAQFSQFAFAEATSTPAVLAPDTATVDASATTAPVTAGTAVVVEAQDKVTIPYANWVDQAAILIRHLGTAALPMLVAFVLTLLPAPIRMIAGPFMQKYSDGIFQKAMDYGVNAVKGATKDGTLTVPVANKVLAHTAQYAIDHGPDWWAKAMGGEDGIRQKIFARLNIPVTASIDDFDTQVAPVGTVAIVKPRPGVKKYRLPAGGK